MLNNNLEMKKTKKYWAAWVPDKLLIIFLIRTKQTKVKLLEMKKIVDEPFWKEIKLN